MPARRSVNLLPQDAFANSFAGKFLFFSITIGRYVVVFTELIVILAFLSRFFLDRQISDLNDRLKEQVGVIDASRDFEQNFRLVQARLTEAKTLSAGQLGATAFLDKITPLISSEVTVTRISVESGTVQLSGASASLGALRQTITSFQNSGWLSEVGLTSVSSGDQTGGGVRFSLSAVFNQSTFTKQNLRQ